MPLLHLTRRPLVVLASSLAVLASVLICQAPTATAEDPGVPVAWPQLTAFNPDLTDYTFEVSGGGDHLFAQLGYYAVEPVAGDGPHTMALAGHNGDHTIRLLRCVPDTDCVMVAESPQLTLRNSLVVSVDDTVNTGVNRPPVVNVHIWPQDSGPVILDWTLTRGYGGPTVDTGTATVAPVADANSSSELAKLTLPVDPSWPADHYWVKVAASTAYPDVPAYGTLSGQGTALVNIDSYIAAPKIKALPTAFYPYPDGYQDSVTTYWTQADGSRVTVDVLDSSGRLTKRILDDLWGWPGDNQEASWDGTDSRGVRVPAGVYTLRYRASDDSANTATVTRTIAVSAKRLRLVTWDRTFNAASTVIAKHVGRCSALSSPARKGWKGSLGYRSMTRCARKGNAALVATQNGIYVPPSPVGRYGDLSISMTSAKAAGSRTTPYIVMGYYRPSDNSFTNRAEVTRSGTRTGRTVRARSFLYDAGARPYVVWGAGLTDGSRWDVRRFTVHMTYYVLG